MKSQSSLPNKFSKIDELTLSDHGVLTGKDHCYYLGEYTARTGFEHSETNQLIINFKKSPDRKGKPEWKYKIQAIDEIAKAFRNNLNQRGLDELTFTPIPPSKSKSDPLYDDRLLKMLNKISPESNLDIREFIVQETSIEAMHKLPVQRDPQQIANFYEFDYSIINPEPKYIAIVDDVLTSGAHFRAMKNVLTQHFPNASFIGLFVARRVHLQDQIF